MMIPEPWEKHESMGPELRAFYRYHASLMEPWDGPANIVFSDGTLIGAVLDRNGLRPSRYWVTDDDLVVMASEVGVMDLAPGAVVEKGRLQPGSHRLQFVVDRHADGLKGTPGRMTLATQCGGDGLRHHFGQDQGVHQWTVCNDCAGDATRRRLLTVLGDDAVEAPVVPGVDHLVRGQTRARVHSHIERTAPVVREAPLGTIQLIGGEPEIEQDADQVVHPGRGQQALEVAKVAQYEIKPQGGGSLANCRIPVNSHDSYVGSDHLSQTQTVTTPAKSGIHQRSFLDGLEQFAHKVGHDRLMPGTMAHSRPPEDRRLMAAGGLGPSIAPGSRL